MGNHIARVRAVRGFSIVELLVVSAIFSVITLVILANHSRFNSSVLLGSLAYNIGLSIREAQVYGLSVQQHGVGQFQVGYGVHFEESDPTHYYLFADTNTNKKYDTGIDSIVRTYSAGQGHMVAQFCGVKTTGERECSDGSTVVTITDLDIVFFRPDPDANISSDQFSFYSSGEITVAAPSGESRLVSVVSTGQISVLTSTP